ncbi:HNH endonuclease [Burkholderia anthina]|uniref:HNH endonuclease n=2 Tax=Burkholderia anthina TaxID=179879 RepID=UPI001ABB6FA0|nr:HNH endonuclease [Burkholderia anthina]MBY4870078.1 HNH endonuclease [Burkholderia anthina]
MQYHIFNIGRPYTNAWWQRNREMGVITAGFDGEKGDRGDIILHDMAEGDWVFAYANRHGFVGAGIVGPVSSYRLFGQHELPDGYEADHRHFRSVNWLHYVTDLGDAVPLSDIDRQAPRQAKEEIHDAGLAERLLERIKVRGQSVSADQWFAEEVRPGETYREGGVEQITVDRYERNSEARRKCVEHWGAMCVVCAFDFGTKYGALGEGFIHVHHLRPLSQIKEEHEVDPIADLRPVCPNCHAMLHRGSRVLTVEELKQLIVAR